MLRFLLIAIFALSLSACGVSPKTHLYVLDTGHELPAKSEGLGIGVWKVRLSELLDRPEIVSRNGVYEVELANFHHWAGRLGPNIDTMVVQGLSQRLDTANVVISPWPSHKVNDYQVKIYIARFDGQLSGEAVVSGTWVLLNGKGNKELVRKPFSLKSPVNGNQYGDVVASLNQLTVELTGLIAEEIERVAS
jgi:uncharacterized lipoprotein YmbA